MPAKTPETLGFRWQPDACNWVRDIPAELGRAYITSVEEGSWGARPDLSDGPVRLTFQVLGQEMGESDDLEEIDIASLTFPTLEDALRAWEVR